MLSIGLMSGTSMDGIDGTLLETDGTARKIFELDYASLRYEPSFRVLLKAAEYAVRLCKGDLQETQSYYRQAIKDYLKYELNTDDMTLPDYSFDEVVRQSTALHGILVKKLLKKTGLSPERIDVIGYHGQTFYHQPNEGISIVVGDGRYLADFLGITVVNDFRRNDVEAGGQGAPFAPIYHQALAIRDNKIPLAVVNCGGIANITLIRNKNEMDLIGYDSGPGNALIDRLVRTRTKGRENCDEDGKYGKKGKIHYDVLAALYEKCILKKGKNFFNIVPPKSLDYGDMILISELDQLPIEDACATLEAFTAETIIKSLELLTSEIPKHWVLAGGGWNNPKIYEEFKTRLIRKIPSVCVQTADEMGWNNASFEAQIFAFLAVRSLQNLPLSLPGTTLVPKPLSGGKIHVPYHGPTVSVKALLDRHPA